MAGNITFINSHSSVILHGIFVKYHFLKPWMSQVFKCICIYYDHIWVKIIKICQSWINNLYAQDILPIFGCFWGCFWKTSKIDYKTLKHQLNQLENCHGLPNAYIPLQCTNLIEMLCVIIRCTITICSSHQRGLIIVSEPEVSICYV